MSRENPARNPAQAQSQSQFGGEIADAPESPPGVTPTPAVVPVPSIQIAPVTVHREPVPIDVYYEMTGEDEVVTHHKNSSRTVRRVPYRTLAVRQERAYIGDDRRATLIDGTGVLDYGPGKPGCYGRPGHLGHR